MKSTKKHSPTKLVRSNELQVKVFQMTKAKIEQRVLCEPVDFLPSFRRFMRQKEPYNNYLVRHNPANPSSPSSQRRSLSPQSSPPILPYSKVASPERKSQQIENHSRMSSSSASSSASENASSHYFTYLQKCGMSSLNDTQHQQFLPAKGQELTVQTDFGLNEINHLRCQKAPFHSMHSPVPVAQSKSLPRVIVSNATSGFKQLNNPLKNDVISSKISTKLDEELNSEPVQEEKHENDSQIQEDKLTNSGANFSIDSIRFQLKPQQPVRIVKSKVQQIITAVNKPAIIANVNPLTGIQKDVSSLERKERYPINCCVIDPIEPGNRSSSPAFRVNSEQRQTTADRKLGRNGSGKRINKNAVIKGIHGFQGMNNQQHLRDREVIEKDLRIEPFQKLQSG